MLPSKSKFDAKFLFKVLIERFSVHPKSLKTKSLKTLLLVGLVTKRQIESVTVKTRLAVEN